MIFADWVLQGVFMKKKNFLPVILFIAASVLFSACKQSISDAEIFTVSLVSDREINSEQFSGFGEYKAGEKVKIHMNWIEKGDFFVGYYDEVGNLLSENKDVSFFMPHHDFKIQVLFYKEGDKPLKAGNYVYFGMYPQENCAAISQNLLDKYIPKLDNYTVNHSVMNQYVFYETGQQVEGKYFYYDFIMDEEYLYKKFRFVHYSKDGPAPYRMSDCTYTYSSSGASSGLDSNTSSWGLISELQSYLYENGMLSEGYYLFEPIKWKILSEKNGKLTLLAVKALDSWQFYHSLENRSINGKTIYPNNWEYSDIREWLNNDFYNTAFTKGCNKYIQNTLLDNVNTAYQPLLEGDDDHVIRIGSNTSTENQNNTTDKVFLPSAKDCCNTEYGFYFDNDGWDPARKFFPTEYSKIMGIRINYGNYHWDDEWNINFQARNKGCATYVWTRSGIEEGYSYVNLSMPKEHQGVICMDDLGDLEQTLYVTKTYVGVVPEIVVSLE